MRTQVPDWAYQVEADLDTERGKVKRPMADYFAGLLAIAIADNLKRNHLEMFVDEKYKEPAVNNKMRKRADGGIANDLAGASMYGGIGNGLGTLIGWFAGKPSKERLAKMDAHPGLSWLPGVGSYRAMRKTLDTMGPEGEKVKRVRSRALSETLGQGTSASLLALAFGGLGAAMMPSGKLTINIPDNLPAAFDNISGKSFTMSPRLAGGIAGGAVGLGVAGIANRLGAIIGNARKRRTEAEQIEADATQGQAPSWLLPGVAAYRNARRKPSITRREDRRNQEAEDRKRQEGEDKD